MNLIHILKEENIPQVAEQLGLPEGEVRAKYLLAEKLYYVLYIGAEELMPIKSWYCDGVKRRPGCKESSTPHSRHSIWENAK